MRHASWTVLSLLFLVLGCELDDKREDPAPIPVVKADPEPEVIVVAAWKAMHAGLQREGSDIPQEGLTNNTLNGALGVAVEPLGEVVEYDGYEFVQGPVSWFGGPEDSGIGFYETGALTGEILRLLNDPMDPTPGDLEDRPEDYYFCAMRWNYSPNGKSWWGQQRLLIIHPETGVAVVVRPVDWGPHVSTDRVLDLSYQAIKDLGLVTDEDAIVAFVPPDTPLGLVK